METKGNILAIVELDDVPKRTIERAIFAARLLGCGIDLVICEHPDTRLPGGISVSAEVDKIRDQLREMLDELSAEYAEQVTAAGVEVCTSLLKERPVSDGIMSRALDTEPQIVMKGTQFHSRAERGILVDTDWHLMRICPFPLWLVKSEQVHEKPVIVAAVDPLNTHDKPASLDQRIIQAAQAIAEPLEGDVHLLHTYRSIASIGKAANRTFTPTRLPIDKIDARTRDEHAKALAELATNCAVDNKHTHLMPGRTRDILPVFVRERNADLVVMGGLARWSLTRNVIGSTAERVLDHLPCDVLIVRDNEYAIGAATTQGPAYSSPRRIF